MTWLVESYDARTEKLLAEIDLDLLAAEAVERLIGDRPAVLTPDQVRVVAPLFDIEPDHWERAMRSPVSFGVVDPDWLMTALAHLVGKVVEERPEDLSPDSYPISPEAAQALVHRFSVDVRVPPGEVFLGAFAP